MERNRFNSSVPGFVLVGITLCSAVALGGTEIPAYPVHKIRFGIIEPPVVAQKDITVRAPTSNQQKEEKPLECSGLAWLNGSLLIVSDRHEHLIFSCSVDLNTMTFGTPQPCVVIPNERDLLQDAESLTVLEKGGRFTMYMMSSLSNAPDAQPLPQRRQLFWGDIKQASPLQFEHSAALSVTMIRQQVEACFEKIKAQPYSTFFIDYPGENKNTYRWGNIEGIAFTPGGQSLLCGMRNPLFDGAAILFVVSGMVRTNTPSQTEALEVTDFFLLDLDDRGVSDLSWDSVTQGYLITAAKSNGPRRDSDQAFPPNTLDSALFWWSGHKNDKPILVARVPDMTVEAVCRLGTSRYIVLGSDEGDISEGRKARQSMLTVLEFTGIPRSSW